MALTRELKLAWIDVPNQALGPSTIDPACSKLQPVNVNGNLYVISYHTVGNTISVYKSTDSGNTWTALDTANQPANPTLGVQFVFDGANFICLPTDGNGAAMYLKNFSTVTDTWGANYATVGAPAAVFVVQAIFIRPDGTYGIFYEDAIGDRFVSYDPVAVAYSAVVVVSNAIITRKCAMDLTGKIHIIMSSSTFSSVAYAAINTNNSLVAPVNFPDNFQNNDAPGSRPAGDLVALSDRLAFACVIVDPVSGVTGDTYIYQGAPLKNPVWTLSAMIQPQIGSNPCYHPNLFVDSSGLWLVVYTNNSTNNNPDQQAVGFLNVNFSTPLVGWQSLGTLYDLNVDAVPINTLRTTTMSGTQGEGWNGGALFNAQPFNQAAGTNKKLFAYMGKWYFPSVVVASGPGPQPNPVSARIIPLPKGCTPPDCDCGILTKEYYAKH